MKRAAFFCLLGLLAPTLVAEAHTELLKAVPAPGSVVDPGINEIRLTFGEAVEEGSSITLFAEGFRAVPDIHAQRLGAEMFAAIPAPLDPGRYTIQWAIVGDDGHTTEGSYQFDVVAGTAQPTWQWWLLIVPLTAGAAYLWRRSRSKLGE